MTTLEVINILKSLQKFIKKDMRMPCAFSWVLEDNFELLEKIHSKYLKSKEIIDKEFIDEDKTIIVLDHGEIKDEFLNEYKARLSEFLLIENDVEIKMVAYSLIDGIDLSSQEIKAIKFMVDREEDETDDIENLE